MTRDPPTGLSQVMGTLSSFGPGSLSQEGGSTKPWTGAQSSLTLFPSFHVNECLLSICRGSNKKPELWLRGDQKGGHARQKAGVLGGARQMGTCHSNRADSAGKGRLQGAPSHGDLTDGDKVPLIL